MKVTKEAMADAHFRGYDRAWAAILSVVNATIEERMTGDGISREEAERRVREGMAARISRDPADVRKWLSRPDYMTMVRFGLLAEALDCDLDITLTVRPSV